MEITAAAVPARSRSSIDCSGVHVVLAGCSSGRAQVEAQREAEGGAAAAQERRQRRREHAIAAPGQFRAQPRTAIRHHHGIAEADGVGGETAPVLAADPDALLRRHP